MAVFAIIAGFISASVWIISSPQALRHAIAIANARSDWKIEISNFDWSPLRSRFQMENVTLKKHGEGKSVSVNGIKIGYKLLGFLRGKLVIDELEIDGANIVMPPKAKNAQKINLKKKRLNLAQLVLLKNLEINNGLVKQISARFGNSNDIEVDEARVSLFPSIFGGTRLSIRIDGFLYKNDKKVVATAGMLKLGTTTRFEEWNNEFPYVDSLGGMLQLHYAILSGLPVDDLKAKLYYNNKKLKLTELNIDVNGKNSRETFHQTSQTKALTFPSTLKNRFICLTLENP